MLSDEPLKPATVNHWKLFPQLYVFNSAPFVHMHIVHLLTSYFPAFQAFRQNKSGTFVCGATNFLLDYFLTLPIIFIAFTCYTNWIYVICAVTMILVHGLPFLSKERNIVLPAENPRRTITQVAPGKYWMTFLNHNISAGFLSMCFGIFFCDTLFFPDELSKQYRDGIGTMDLGAGFILFITGATSRQTRDLTSGLAKRFKTSYGIILICVNIGLLRMLLAELTGKGDFSHGTHWNIFLILACIMIISICIPNQFTKYAYLLAIATEVIYQIFLSMGLEDYLLDTTRHHNFFERNAVGFCQTFGFMSCYFIGMGFGRKLYNLAITKTDKSQDKEIFLELLMLIAGSMIIFVIAYTCLSHTGPRVCNLAYVSYISLIGNFCMIVTFVQDRLTVKEESNIICDGPGKTSRLIYFIIANSLTGIINISCEVAKLSMGVQLVILMGYTLVLHVIFAVFVGTGVKVRFW